LFDRLNLRSEEPSTELAKLVWASRGQEAVPWWWPERIALQVIAHKEGVNVPGGFVRR
jgi:hypothetical protein